MACGSNRFVGRGVDSSPNEPSSSALVQAPHNSRTYIRTPSDSGRLQFSGYGGELRWSALNRYPLRATGTMRHSSPSIAVVYRTLNRTSGA